MEALLEQYKKPNPTPTGHFVAYVRLKILSSFICLAGSTPEVYGLPPDYEHFDIACQDTVKVCGPIVVLYCTLRYMGLSHDRFVSLPSFKNAG